MFQNHDLYDLISFPFKTCAERAKTSYNTRSEVICVNSEMRLSFVSNSVSQLLYLLLVPLIVWSEVRGPNERVQSSRAANEHANLALANNQ